MRTKILLIGTCSLISLIALLMLTITTQPPQAPPLLGTIKLKEESDKQKQHPDQKDHSLRYKAPIKRDNPFLALYQEKPPGATTPKPHTKTQQPQKETQGFFSAYNTDQHSDTPFFTATSQKQQPLQEGKPIQLLLKDPIPALDLPAGTLLKGSPSWQGTRVMINITAASVHGKVRPLKLLCFDPNDCLEGLFYDQIDSALEHEIKDALLEEALDFNLPHAKQLRKAASIASNYTRLQLEKGREILVALPSPANEPAT
ncbi:MAG: conjugative transposon protein TraM [Roseivirga sp.]